MQDFWGEIFWRRDTLTKKSKAKFFVLTGQKNDLTAVAFFFYVRYEKVFFVALASKKGFFVPASCRKSHVWEPTGVKKRASRLSRSGFSGALSKKVVRRLTHFFFSRTTWNLEILKSLWAHPSLIRDIPYITRCQARHLLTYGWTVFTTYFHQKRLLFHNFYNLSYQKYQGGHFKLSMTFWSAIKNW